MSNYFSSGTGAVDTNTVNTTTYTTPTFGNITSTLTIGNVTSTTLSDADNTIWFPHYMESTWLPYHYTPYNPEWHKKYARYKIQMEKMWDSKIHSLGIPDNEPLEDAERDMDLITANEWKDWD